MTIQPVRWIPDEEESQAWRCARGTGTSVTELAWRDGPVCFPQRICTPAWQRRQVSLEPSLHIAPSSHTSTPGHQDCFPEMAKEADRGPPPPSLPHTTSNDLRSWGHDTSLPLLPGWRHPCGAGCRGSPDLAKLMAKSSYEPGICTAS